MSEAPKSILSQIYHMANPYGLEPMDRVDTGIVGLDVVSNAEGYKITSEVGFFGEGTFGGVTISVKADGGILNQDGDLKGAEVGKGQLPGMLAFEVTHTEVDELSTLLGEPALTQMQGRIIEQPRQEALYLPGEPGFELFRELHGKIDRVAEHIGAAARLLELDPSPIFSFRQGVSGAHYDHDKKTATYSSTDYYGLGISAQDVRDIDELAQHGYQIPDRPDRRHMLEMGIKQTMPVDAKPPKNSSYNQAVIHEATDYRLLHIYPDLTGEAITRTYIGSDIADFPGIFPAFNALRQSLAELHNNPSI